MTVRDGSAADLPDRAHTEHRLTAGAGGRFFIQRPRSSMPPPATVTPPSSRHTCRYYSFLAGRNDPTLGARGFVR
jgi:hypothetical protein